MTLAIDIVRDFYNRLSTGDAPGALGLMAPDIEWLVVEGWPYKPAGHGPRAVADGVLMPMLGEWDGFGVEVAEVLPVGDGSALALGRYIGRHKTTAKPMSVALAHLWDVAGGRLARFRGQADTLTLDRARS